MMFTDFEAISVGDSESLVKDITENDVKKFVSMTGDDNPLHVDRDYAETTPFKDIVVHGMLGASFISTVIGTKLPGRGALWVSQNMEFVSPVRLGDELTITCTVLKKHERERLLELETVIVNQNNSTVLTGFGTVKVLKTTEPKVIVTSESTTKVAIVTGGAGGIGKAICLRLASKGFAVVINHRGRKDRADEISKKINESEKGRAIAVKGDITNEEDVSALFDAAKRTFGGVNVVVNNASPAISPKDINSLRWEDIQKQIDVQVKGAFSVTKAAIPYMIENKWGRIINITSQAIEGQPTPSWTGYAMAKGALATFTKQLAVELGPHGITTNSVAPGMCETSLIGDVSEKSQLIIARQTPLRRLAKPEDVAAAVSYLASDDASFVNGEVVAVNGGIAIR